MVIQPFIIRLLLFLLFFDNIPFTCSLSFKVRFFDQEQRTLKKVPLPAITIEQVMMTFSRSQGAIILICDLNFYIYIGMIPVYLFKTSSIIRFFYHIFRTHYLTKSSPCTLLACR